MTKKSPSKQLTLETAFFSTPDAISQNKPKQSDRSNSGKRRSTKKTPAVVPESQQPFLPGLSRRGRPRSANPVSPTVRASESRRRRTEAGARRIELVLDAAIAGQLDSLSEHFKISRVELVSRLIAQAAKRLRAKQ